jgi:hypothetical protein
MRTLTLKKNKDRSPAPKHWVPFVDRKVTIRLKSGHTLCGMLKEVFVYEVLLDEIENGEMLILKSGVECINRNIQESGTG